MTIQTILRRGAALCLTLMLILTLSACYQPPGATITPNGDTTTTTADNSEDTPKPTTPHKDGQMTLSILMGVMSTDMKWSQISMYNHNMTDDTHATFAVADNYGKECTMSVTVDTAADTISEATLSYGDQSVDVLSDNTLVIRKIMIAMNNG